MWVSLENSALQGAKGALRGMRGFPSSKDHQDHQSISQLEQQQHWVQLVGMLSHMPCSNLAAISLLQQSMNTRPIDLQHPTKDWHPTLSFVNSCDRCCLCCRYMEPKSPHYDVKEIEACDPVSPHCTGDSLTVRGNDAIMLWHSISHDTPCPSRMTAQ